MKKTNLKNLMSVAVLSTSILVGSASQVIASNQTNSQALNMIEKNMKMVDVNKNLIDMIKKGKVDLKKFNDNGYMTKIDNGCLILAKDGEIVILNFNTWSIIVGDYAKPVNLRTVIANNDIFEYVENIILGNFPKVTLSTPVIQKEATIRNVSVKDVKDIEDILNRIENGGVIDEKELEDIADIVVPAENSTTNEVADKLDKLLKDKELTKEILKKLEENQDEFDKIFGKEERKPENPAEDKKDEKKPAEDKKDEKKPSEDKKEEEKPAKEKTKDEILREKVKELLEDEDLTNKIIQDLNKNQSAFEKLFDFRTDEEKKLDKFIEDLTNSIKDQNSTKEILDLLEKDKDIFDKLIGKDEKQPEVPADDNKEDKKQPETPTEDNKQPESPSEDNKENEKQPEVPAEDNKEDNKQPETPADDKKENPVTPSEDKKQPETPVTPSENGKKTVTEADIDAYIEKMEKDNYILSIKDRNKSVTGPILERTEYKDVKIRDKNGNITTVRVKYLTGLSEESWKIVNEHRKAHGLPEVQAPSRTLQEAANIRAAELYYNYKAYDKSHPNHFDHVRPDGRRIGTSMNNFGGENILYGNTFNLNDDYEAARQTFTVFKNSDGHNKNMLWDNSNKKPIAQERRLAIATVVSEDEPNLVFQVQLFGSSIWGDENHSLLDAGEKVKFNDNSVEPIYNKDGSEEYARKKHEENKRKGVRQFLETGEWPETKSKVENQVDNAKEEFKKNEEEHKAQVDKTIEEREKDLADKRKAAEDEYTKKQEELEKEMAREDEEERKRLKEEVGVNPAEDNNKSEDKGNSTDNGKEEKAEIAVDKNSEVGNNEDVVETETTTEGTETTTEGTETSSNESETTTNESETTSNKSETTTNESETTSNDSETTSNESENA